MTAPKNKGGRPPGRVLEKANEELSSNEHRLAIYAGATMYDIEILFGVTRRTVQRKLAGMKPTGKRGVHDTWQIRDVAGKFVRPEGDMEEWIKSARPTDLPPELHKEFWNALRAKQKFLVDEGGLWQTERVVQVIGEMIQVVRTGLLLVPDELERRARLTDEQRDQVQNTVDDVLNELRKKIKEHFDREATPADLPGAYNLLDDRPSEEELDDVFEPSEDEDDELDLDGL
jgi:hypothetical protein